MNQQGQSEKLFDMRNDPWETENQIESTDPEARSAKRRLEAVIQRLPERDALPRYVPNPPQTWDRFEYRPSP